MTYEKIFDDVKKTIGKVDEKKLDCEFAFQMNITGEGEGIFYIANKNGAFAVEPYDYKDNDAVFTADGDTYKALFSGAIDFDEALSLGKLSVSGNTGIARVIKSLVKVPEKKAAKKVEEVKAKIKSVKAKAEPKKAAVKAKAKEKKAKIEKVAEKAAEEIKSTALSTEKKVTTIAKTAAVKAKTELDNVKEAVKAEKEEKADTKPEKLNK